jgi:Flp pilus assembly protein CpaB
MRRGRLLILIALLLVAVSVGGLLLVFFILRPTTPQGGGEPTQAPEVTSTPIPVLYILRAAQDLPRGALIPTEALAEFPWPTDIVPTDAVLARDPTQVAQIVGSRARITIARGMPIFNTMIVRSLKDISPTGSDAAAQIPPGFVAITLPYNRTAGVAYGIKDGDYVNVLTSWAVVDIDQDFQTVLPNRTTNILPAGSGTADIPPGLYPFVVPVQGGPVGKGQNDSTVNQDFYVVPSEAQQRARLVTQAIIQNALVLHVGDFPETSPFILPPPTNTPDPAQTPSPPPPPTSTPLPPDVITLAVPPQDALVLNYVLNLAARYPTAVSMTYVLRSAGDTTLTETESVTLQYMFERFSIALPAKLNYGLTTTTP